MTAAVVDGGPRVDELLERAVGLAATADSRERGHDHQCGRETPKSSTHVCFLWVVLLFGRNGHGAALSARSMPLRGLPRPVTKSKLAGGVQTAPHAPLAGPLVMSASPDVRP